MIPWLGLMMAGCPKCTACAGRAILPAPLAARVGQHLAGRHPAQAAAALPLIAGMAAVPGGMAVSVYCITS